ncbi:transporter substrate-binding domain-containing protein [Polynucleobacter antarcticus]|nr:transporter substrate-binding domain-containing protein [Polynucleobacter antarcticus]
MVIFSVGCSKSDDKNQKILQVAIAPTVPPQLFIENGKPVGVDLEIFKGFCESRGYRYNLKSYDFQGMLGAVASGQADIAFSGISITEKRLKVMDFSNPYIQTGWDLVSLKKRNIHITNLDQMKTFSIGFPTGTVFMGYIENEWQPKGIYKVSKVKLYPSYNEALTDLNNGNLDLVFTDSSMLSAYINKLNMPVQSSYEIAYADKLGFAFIKGSPIKEDFNKYLAELGPDKIKSFEAKWSK